MVDGEARCWGSQYQKKKGFGEASQINAGSVSYCCCIQSKIKLTTEPPLTFIAFAQIWFVGLAGITFRLFAEISKPQFFSGEARCWQSHMVAGKSRCVRSQYQKKKGFGKASQINAGNVSYCCFIQSKIKLTTEPPLTFTAFAQISFVGLAIITFRLFAEISKPLDPETDWIVRGPTWTVWRYLLMFLMVDF